MINFTKMHGLGNDFVVIDAIGQDINLTAEQVHFIADRHFGVGCDQLLLVERPVRENADFKYRIFNADGGEVAQCGNGARCFARFVREKKLTAKDEVTVDTNAGQLLLRFIDGGLITVNMGVPKHAPEQIPLLMKDEAVQYSLEYDGGIVSFSALSMGNPHAVIQVEDVVSAPLETVGPWLEKHPVFSERVNVGFMQVVNRQRIKLRVYERGAAETLACGSGACAAVVAGIEQGLLDSNVSVGLPGGDLLIEWAGRGQPVFMSGPAVSVYEGQIRI
ncbi:diaminopimelate epimerase [Methylomonas methanica]|uniref:Diaminopimelate epimerase n=1 Tax=Methylomonas methanica (strain DSM 25384 / MC09) TaxID=857087 RepID=G0A0N9_METMM|nr:diaminopimelate epimerase [Methylomonas methanica]AEF98815.1 Diaminopimelate epimerase [Methylomonas methanica MC09]